MLETEVFMLPGPPGLLALALFLAASTLLYFAREPMQQSLRAACRALHQALRLAARSVARAEERLAARNRELAAAAARQLAERRLEREFERVDAAIRRDLGDFPLLHRRMSDALQRIDAQYQAGAETPPAPGDWVCAVEAVATLPAKEGVVAEVLREIHASLERGQNEALLEYREHSARRQRLLRRTMPRWRDLLRGLNRVDRNVERLLERARGIDRHMAEFESSRLESPAPAVLSSLSRLVLAGLLLLVATGVAMVNFDLTAQPMLTLVGPGRELLGFEAAQVTAFAMLLVEMVCGLVLMESLRVTGLFPAVGALDHRLRVRIAWGALALLLALAGIAAGLAYLSPLPATGDYGWIALGARIGMGLVLPIALAFVAMPLESFVHAARAAAGSFGVVALRLLGFLLRLCGGLVRSGGAVALQVYDLLIFGPLWLERQWQLRGSRSPRLAPEADDAAPPLAAVGKAAAR